MLAIDNFVGDTLKRLEQIAPLNCLDIRSYKKNRKIVIEKLEEGYNLYEEGFHEEVFYDLSKEELKKLLKIIEKREFPRSNKLRLYVLDSRESSAARANYRQEVEEEEQELEKVFLKCPYNLFTPIKSLLEEQGGEIINVDFREEVGIQMLLNEVVYSLLKEYVKDEQNIELYTYY